MLTTYTSDPTLSIAASKTPEVYIDSCEISSGSVSIFYHIEDYAKEWFINDFVLDNLHLSMSLSSSEQILYNVESLRSLKNRLEIKDGKAYDYINFKINTKSVVISACCFSNELRGNETVEHITQNGDLTKNTLNLEEYDYINKNYDLRLLDIENNNVFTYNLTSSTTASITNQQNYISELYVSNNVNKSANLGFVFDIEYYLEQHSNTYNLIKNNIFYKEIILRNSYIAKNSIKIYKKNISKENEEYYVIDSPSKILKLDDGIENNKFLITCNDVLSDKYNKDKYIVKTSFLIRDFSEELIRNNILYGIDDSKKYILKYIDLFDKCSKNSLIKDANIYIFEQEYEKEQTNIKENIKNLSYIFAFYTGGDLEKYYSLFLSIFHPLFTNVRLLNLLLNKLEIIERNFNSFLNDLDLFKISNNSFKNINNINLENAIEENISNNVNKPYLLLEHEFYTTGLYGEKDFQTLDYSFDADYGLEVLDTRKYESRKQQIYDGLKIITIPEFNARKLTEVIKYYGIADQKISNELQHFSCLGIDLGKIHYQIIDQSTLTNNDFNDIVLYLNDYNDRQFNFSKPESYYYQLLQKNINIKSISSRNNDSRNPAQRTTVFDPNIDSKIKSIQYMSDTGINVLYYLLDKNSLLELPNNSMQYEASLESGKYGTSISPITSELKDNFEVKPKFISLYNNFYNNQMIESGSNYSIYQLQPACVNSIFDKKLITYDKYYVVENKKYIPYEQQTINVYEFEKEINFNTLPKFLNRNIVNSKFIVNLEDL